MTFNKVHCDQRQLLYFRRFLEDWQAYQEDNDNYPAGLLTLSSAEFIWREGTGKGKPWNVNRLALHCTFDTRLMTAEGTEQVRQEKLSKTAKNLATDTLENDLSETQKQFQQRSASTVRRLQNVPSRPSCKPYHGKPEILIGLSLGLEQPVTVTVVNVATGKVSKCQTARSLLGEQSNLLRRYQNQQKKYARQRHKQQRQKASVGIPESNLGEYLDQLLAKRIVEFAQREQASSIVIPDMANLRTLRASEIKARAERKCPGCVEAQKKYAKEVQQKLHRWSYRRLLDTICSKAKQCGISIEVRFQPILGNPQIMARDIAIAAYHSRINSNESSG